MKQESVIHTKMLEVVQWLFVKVNTFPKKQRFILGQQIEKSSLKCLRFIIEANKLHQENDILRKLELLDVELDVLRDLLRVAYDVGFMKVNSLQYITIQIDEVGKIRGGWAKHYMSSKSNN